MTPKLTSFVREEMLGKKISNKKRGPCFYLHIFKPKEKNELKSVSLNMTEALAFLGFRYEDGMQKSVVCSDGKKRDLVIIPFRIIMKFEEDREVFV